MAGEKAFQVLSTLQESERASLRRFLLGPHSPHENKLTQLLDAIFHLIDTGQTEAKGRGPRIWKVAFPQQPFEESRLRTQLGNLVRKTEAFWVIDRQLREARDLSLEFEFNVLEIYRKRNIEKAYLRQYNKLISKMNDKKGYLSSEDFLYRWKIEMEHYNFIVATQKRSEQTTFAQLRAVMARFDEFTALNQIQFYCESLISLQASFINSTQSVEIDPQFLAQLSAPPYADWPLFEIYASILQALLHPDKLEDFHQLKSLLKRHTTLPREEAKPKNSSKKRKKTPPRLATGDAQEIYNLLQNLCIRRVNHDPSGPFLKELYGLYQDRMENDTLLVHGYLPRWDYKNITTLGLRLGKTEETHTFLEKHKEKIHPDFQENAYNYNRAHLLLHSGEIAKAKTLLQKVVHEDELYALGVRFFLLRCHWELEEFDDLFTLIDSTHKFVQRNKVLAPTLKKRYRTRLNFHRRVANAACWPKGQYLKRIGKLRQDIIDNPGLVDRDYLLQKLSHYHG